MGYVFGGKGLRWHIFITRRCCRERQSGSNSSASANCKQRPSRRRLSPLRNPSTPVPPTYFHGPGIALRHFVLESKHRATHSQASQPVTRDDTHVRGFRTNEAQQPAVSISRWRAFPCQILETPSSWSTCHLSFSHIYKPGRACRACRAARPLGVVQ